MINFLRHVFCVFFAFVMFTGVIQIGLRWESLQPVSRVLVNLKNGQSVIGDLSQNLSGDFVVQEKGIDHVFTPSQINFFQLQNAYNLNAPWRIIFSISLASVMSSIAWLFAMSASTVWMVNFGLTEKPKVSSLKRPAKSASSLSTGVAKQDF